MNRRLAWSMHVTNAIAAATGLALGWCVYGPVSEDPEALARHPWQATLQHVHVLAAPGLVAALGAAWIAHAWPKWSSGASPARRSGLALVALALPMLASGYLLQVATSLEARAAWSLAHTLASLLWILASIVHLLAARGAARHGAQPVPAPVRGYTGPSGDEAASSSRRE